MIRYFNFVKRCYMLFSDVQWILIRLLYSLFVQNETDNNNNLLAELSNLGVIYIRTEKWPEHGSPRKSRDRPSSRSPQPFPSL